MRQFAAVVAAAALLLSIAGPVAAAAPGSSDLSPDASGRWIVLLKPGTDSAATASSQGRSIGFKADRTYRNVLRGYAAKLSGRQVSQLRTDHSVAAVVPDERISIEAQTIPTGIQRIGATVSPVAVAGDGAGAIDADVAIVDTGVSRVPDLNVVGGYSCANSTTTAWQDGNGHGTHVAGTVGAIDDGSGVVGVAPGVRIWSVKILDNTGSGLLSWYLCGLDWITAQRDPSDPSRPLFEAANMSVAKWGHDDGNCGFTNADALHQAICRVVASGVTVVAAAANDAGNASLRVPASYDEVITVSALADTDGKPGGLGGNRCFSWGGYDQDDTFADFSNYGSDVDLIAPGKCIWSTIPSGFAYMSGTSMAAPHVTGAVALLKQSRPYLTPAEVREALRYLGTSNWKTSTDPDHVHEPLLDVSRIAARGNVGVAAAGVGWIGPNGGTASVPIMVSRSDTSFERVTLTASGLPSGVTADPASTYGFGPAIARVPVHVPAGAIGRPTTITITADEHGARHATTATMNYDADLPSAPSAPSDRLQLGGLLGRSTLPVVLSWSPATDPTSGVGGYEVQYQLDGGAWVSDLTTTTTSVAVMDSFGRTYRFRVRARDGAGNWSALATGAPMWGGMVEDTSRSVTWHGPWTSYAYSGAMAGTSRWSATAGASASYAFTGRAIAIVAPKGPARGTARVYVDGIYRTTISLYRSTNVSKMLVYVESFRTTGSHRIELRLAGSRRVDVDAFVILR